MSQKSYVCKPNVVHMITLMARADAIKYARDLVFCMQTDVAPGTYILPRLTADTCIKVHVDNLAGAQWSIKEVQLDIPVSVTPTNASHIKMDAWDLVLGHQAIIEGLSRADASATVVCDEQVHVSTGNSNEMYDLRFNHAIHDMHISATTNACQSSLPSAVMLHLSPSITLSTELQWESPTRAHGHFKFCQGLNVSNMPTNPKISVDSPAEPCPVTYKVIATSFVVR